MSTYNFKTQKTKTFTKTKSLTIGYLTLRKITMQKSVHIPVLLQASLDHLKPKIGESYLDLTAGYGGHASNFLAVTKNYTQSVLVDRDQNAVDSLGFLIEKGARMIHSDFLSASEQLVREGRKFDIILADFGVSSPQLDIAERGFSFLRDGDLDMRMNPSQELTANYIVNKYSKKELLKILVEFGEEKREFSERIVDKIIETRKKNPITSTTQLADLILSVHKGGWQKTHPATRTFQAIRIAVNQELEQIEKMLLLLPKMLNPGGRVGIITFHSLEDKLVKNYFKQDSLMGLESNFLFITKKPVSGAVEDAHNPRSRSAKLRVSIRK